MKISCTAISVALVLGGLSSNPVAADNTMVVTANRIKQDINTVLADVEVITRQDIERIQASSFAELLSGIAGLDLVNQGGHGQTTSLFLRGTSSDKTLILIDGVRVGSATLGYKSLANIAVSQIERVEIVKGPRAAIWGSDAMGGVIQIFTRRLASGEHSAVLTAGSNGLEKRELAIGFGSKQFNNTFTYGLRKTDGINARLGFDPDDDGSSNESFALRGDYRMMEGHEIDWVIQQERANVEFDSWFGGDLGRTDSQVINLRYSTELSDWATSFALKNSKDDSVNYNAVDGYDAADQFVTERFQASLLTQKPLMPSLNFIGALDWYEDDISESTSAYAEEKRAATSFMLGLNYVGENWLYDIAMRSDEIDGLPSSTTANLGLGYQLNSNQQVSLNFAEGFKAPSFNDLYFPFGGNPDLNFETSENLELVYKAHFGAVNMSAVVFDSEIENLIQWMPDVNGNWSPQNVGQADISGATLEANFSQGDFTHQASISYVDPKDGQTGQVLIRRAKEQASYRLGFQGETLDLSLQLLYVGERRDNDYQTFLPVMLDSSTQLNFSAGYWLDRDWKVSLKLNDLTDEAATQVSGYRPLGREVQLSISHQNLF